MASTQRERAEAFRALHEGPPFLIPNPWDAGSAKVLATAGFEALATTSSGFAFTLGRSDGEVTLDELCAHVATITAAVDVPLAADLENGFGPAPEDAARAISRVAEAGAVGGSIEDWEADAGIYEQAHATERIAAAREAADALDFPFTLTARAENHIRGNPDLDDTIARLRSYEEAGADVLFAPGLSTVEEIQTVCQAVGPPRERPRLRQPQLRRDCRSGRPTGERRRSADLGGGGRARRGGDRNSLGRSGRGALVIRRRFPVSRISAG